MNKNLLDIDEEAKQKTFQQAMDIWINPEIERRKLFNKMPNDFKLEKAQIIFSLEGNEVRLNKEVKAIVHAKINREIKEIGEKLYEQDIDDIEKIELTDEDSNCAHITLLLFKNNWIIGFDARYNKDIIKEHIKASKEFFESAKDNLSKNRLRSFFEDAFASAELSATSVLLMLPDKKILTGRIHKDRRNKFKNWAELGNVEIEFSNTLSKLSNLRDSARYLHSEEFKNEDPNKIILTLKEMIDFAEYSIN